MKELSNSITDSAVVAALVHPEVHVINGRHIIVERGSEPIVIEESLLPPPHIVQTLETSTLDSLRGFIDMHRGTDHRLVLFADVNRLRFTAVFDYHFDADSTDHCHNKAYYGLTEAPAFTRWNQKFGQWITQEAFIDLIENNEASLHTPASAIMLELAQNLEIHTSEKVVAKKSLRNGTGNITFETTEGEASTKVPETITIGIPIYKGLKDAEGKPKGWLLKIRLRYRVKNGEVLFCLIPVQLEELLDTIWRDIVAEVAEWKIDLIEGEVPSQR